MARLVVEIGKGAEGERTLEALRAKVDKLGGSARILNDDLGKLNRQNQAVERRYQSLARALDPAIAKQHALARATQTLTRALQTGVIQQKEHDRLLGLARQKYSENASAANSLGGSIGQVAARYTGLAAILSTVAGVLTKSLTASLAAEESATRLAVAVRLKGAAYGVEAGRLQQYAAELQNVARFEDDAIMRAEAILLRFDSIDGNNIERVTQLTLDFAEATGQDATAAANALGKALEVPGEGLRALAQAGIVLEPRQKKLIRDLVETGRAAEAQAELIGLLEAKIGGLSRELGATSGGAIAQFKNAIGDLFEELGAAGPKSVAADFSTVMTPAIQAVTGALQDLSQSSATEGPRIKDALLSMVKSVASPLGNLTQLLKNAASNMRVLEIRAAGSASASTEIKDRVKVTNWAPDLIRLRAQIDLTTRVYDPWNAVMDEATERMLGNQKAAKELQKEVESLTKKYSPAVAKQQEWARDLVRLIELYKQGAISGSMLAKALEDIEQEYQKLMNVGAQKIELPSADELLDRIAKGFADEVAKLEQDAEDLQAMFDAITDINLGDLARDQVPAILRAEKEHAREVSAIWEGTWQDIYAMGANALHGFIDGAKITWEDLGKELLHIFADLLLRLLQEWITHETTKTAITATEAGKRATLETGGKSGGGGMPGMGGGGGGWMQTAFGASGGNASSAMYGVGWAAVAIAAIAALSNAFQKSQQAKRYDTSVGYSMKDGSMYGGAYGPKAEKTGAAILTAMGGLVDSIQQSTGVLLGGINQASIQVRHDGKAFKAIVNAEVLGVFKTAEEAVIAAVKAMFTQGDLAGELAPAIRDVLTNFKGTDPAQLAESVKFVQGILDATSGLSDLEIQLRALPGAMAQVEMSLRNMGVSAVEASRLTNLWAINELAGMRDQITGRQRTAEEEMALRQQQAALWNAQRVMLEIQIRAEYEALLAKRAIIEGGGVLAEIEMGIAKDRLSGLAQVIQTEADLANAELEVKQEYAETSAEILVASMEFLNQQIAALETVLGQLENLPLIDPGEIRLPDIGGGGIAVGDTGPKLPTAEEWREELAQYTRTALEGQLAEIRRWADEQREIAEQIGESVELVNDAERARLAALGEQILGGLGVASVDTEAQYRELAETLEFLRQNLDALGISAERFAEITRELGDQMFLSLADGLLQYVENEDVRRELEQMRYQMEIANYRLQFELLKNLGILTQEQIDLIQGLIDDLPTEAPGLGGGGGGGFGGGGGGRDMSRLNERLDALRRALDRLRNFYENLYHDEQLSPLSTAEQFAIAQQEWLDLLALAQTGDPDAIAALPEAAQQFLQLAAQMFGTSTQSYLDIFNAVVGAIEGILGTYEEPDAWYWLQTSMGTVTSKLTSSANYLEGIYNELVGWGGGGGGGHIPPIGGGGEHALLGTGAVSAAAFGAQALALLQGRPAANAGNLLQFRPQRPQLQGGQPATPSVDTSGLQREIQDLGRRLDAALERLAKAQESAGERRARAGRKRAS